MPKTVTDAELVNKAIEFITDADADELSNIIGNMFGVKCTFNEEELNYEISPNKDYCGAFGEL
jgi:hypothetical protein